ncbi:OmpW family protein [Formicincola oecophyllae]|uniref:OmpW family protein n=2 Tax=Formicincola oecophyllae TaxID=2558361 RepID=A0A4Y6UB67_9PROT|nr:OmpW family protein [Formicincola oecophyllae]
MAATAALALPAMAAAAPVTTVATTSTGVAPMPKGMQAAPDVNVNVAAPADDDSGCGLWKTCKNTRIGFGAGDIVLGLSAIGVITNNTSSGVTINGVNGGAMLGGKGAALNGKGTNYIPGTKGAYSNGTHGKHSSLTSTDNAMPEMTIRYFITDNISLEAIASMVHLHYYAHNTAASTLNAVTHNQQWNKLDVGHTWVLPPTLTAAWHFRPHKRFNPYVGVGFMLAFFPDNSPGKNDQATLAKLGVGGHNRQLFQRLKIQTTPAVAFDFGFDYQVLGNWFWNFDVKQALMHTSVFLNHKHAQLTNGQVHAHSSINPTILGTGIAYRF